MNRADDLERIIAHLDTLYYTGDDCIHPDTNVIVSDGEYDSLRRELASLRLDSKIFTSVTASDYSSVVKKIAHKPPLTSISKASHEDRDTQEQQLFKWIHDRVNALPKNGKSKIYTLDKKYANQPVTYPAGYFYQTYKLDGIALGIYYKDGNLVAAGLRPRDGVNGEDVTEQTQYVDGIPQKLSLPLTFSIRGEVICKLSDFAKVQKELEEAGEQLRANPRNHAAGGIRQFKDPSKVKKQRLSFIAYAIEGLDNPPYKTEIERAKWCNKVLGIPFVQAREFNFNDLDKMEENVKNLDYNVDGVIVGVNDLEDQEQLGRHGDTPTGNPRGKIAWKFAEERAKPEVKGIPWKTGRTGAIKPVGTFDAVPLAGTQVRRATLHNIGFMFRNKIGIGTQVIVLKAGNIIPKVVGVAAGHVNYKDVSEVPHPANCPSCNHKTSIHKSMNNGEEMYELMCENSSCVAKNIQGLIHYLDQVGVLGLGESKITALVEGGVVRNIADFYKLTVDKAMTCDLSRRQALLAIAGIHQIPSPDKIKDDDKLEKQIEKIAKSKKVIPAWKLFAAFGIESAGKSAGKALIEHFGSFDAIRSASVAELSAVPDVGEKTAKIVFDWLASNKQVIDELLKFAEPEMPKTGPLSGKSFVLTGSFAEGKRHYQDLIEAQGGKIGGSVSQSTTYVVEGVDAGSKAEKAKTLNIPIITVDTLKKILGV